MSTTERGRFQYSVTAHVKIAARPSKKLSLAVVQRLVVAGCRNGGGIGVKLLLRGRHCQQPGVLQDPRGGRMVAERSPMPRYGHPQAQEILLIEMIPDAAKRRQERRAQRNVPCVVNSNRHHSVRYGNGRLPPREVCGVGNPDGLKRHPHVPSNDRRQIACARVGILGRRERPLTDKREGWQAVAELCHQAAALCRPRSLNLAPCRR